MIWRFSIIESDSTTTVVDEPVGWDGVAYSLDRNMIHHGIFQGVDTNGFEFIEDAYDLLSAEYIANGANGEMYLQIEYNCDDTYQQFFTGKFDFNTFQRQCADTCLIKCSITSTACADVFMSRMGQDVDPDNTTNFDGDAITACPNVTLNIEGQDIFLQNTAYNEGTSTGNLQVFPQAGGSSWWVNFCPLLPKAGLGEFGVFNANGNPVQLATSGNVTIAAAFAADPFQAYADFGEFLAVWVRESDPLNCIDNDATIDIITKGTLNVTPTNFDCNFRPIMKFFKYNTLTGDLTEMDTNTITFLPCTNGNLSTQAFNKTFSNTPAYAECDVLIYCFQCEIETTVWDGFSTREVNFSIDFDNTTKFEMSLNSNCDASTAKSYKLPDLLKHLPTAYLSTDCPELTIEENLEACLDNYTVTKGSMIRQVTEPSAPNLFTSFEWLFNECRKVFNIGWGFSNNDTELFIGNIEDFYQATPIVNVGLLDKAMFTTAKDLICGSVAIGYNKWEAEEYNGLDETNTERKYRRNTNSNPLQMDLMSDIITAGYTIEVTRRKNQTKTGTSDWRYDDDLFLINTAVDDGLLYAYRGTSDAANIYSPSTRMNLRLTPVRNLMRWFRSISAANPTIANDELIFTSGTGNYIAQCRFADQCFVETGITVENQTIDSTDVVDNTPVWKTIYAEFDAPLTMTQFETIKTNPYGAITFRCKDDIYNGSIVTMSHDPNVGLAKFKLLLLP